MHLSVNIDHVATLREVRGTVEPDPVWAAVEAELGGADGITVHLREDRRHIQERDLALLTQVVRTHLNMEMAVLPVMVEKALQYRPNMVTLVPEKRDEITTEGGLDLVAAPQTIAETIDRLHAAGIAVSAFIDPDAAQVRQAAHLGCDFVELHTGELANARDSRAEYEEFTRLAKMADAAERVKLGVNAGHGLNYKNIDYILQIPQINEVSIGHAIIARALLTGLRDAVREMVDLLRMGRRAG